MKIYNSLYQKENTFKYLTGFQSCCDTSYSMDGTNQMWILPNLSEYIESRSSPYVIALKHLTSLPATQLFPTQNKKTD